MDDVKRAARKFFRPKYPECSTQCASCPFLVGNDDEWLAMVKKLRAVLGVVGRVTKAAALYGRLRARLDVANRGDFFCHSTVYMSDGKSQRPVSEWRQCPGATKLFRGETT